MCIRNSTKSAAALSRATSNKERSERIRKTLGYTKIPVLRNRQRTFFFAESDELDGFGPGSAALGPPEEMSSGEIYSGRTARGSDNVDPKFKIDWSESFPISGSRR